MRSSGHPLDLFEFLSTPSARRATDEVKANNALIEISIHALREEGDRGKSCRSCGRGISIHALREEGDISRISIAISSFPFLSTPSARRATYGDETKIQALMISIHALREEGDKPDRGRCSAR